MIISITGKPCSGKGTAAKEFCKKYNFEYVGTGDMFREFSKQYGYDNILDFQTKNSAIKEIDKLIDDKTIQIGKTRLNENIVFDSRLAWHFIPKSFKVFIDVNPTTAAKRLLNSNRDTEHASTLEEASKNLEERWNIENARYQELYNIDNLNLNNYDLVVDSSNITPSEVVDEIHKKYLKFLEK